MEQQFQNFGGFQDGEVVQGSVPVALRKLRLARRAPGAKFRWVDADMFRILVMGRMTCHTALRTDPSAVANCMLRSPARRRRLFLVFSVLGWHRKIALPIIRKVRF